LWDRSAAHQLRNPIAGVLSLAEAVDRAPNAQAARERTRDLLAAARETADLSNKLLILERAKAQESGQAHEALDLHALLTQWAEDLSQSVPSSVTFRSDIRPDLRPSAGDPTMLRETLRNLVDNALSHGGPDVSQIRLRAWQAGGQAQISVEDNGQGLPEDQREAAFERFRPLAASSGSGLGLSIARAVAEAHGGAIWLEDAAPGLRVTLSLPSV
ncbi:MAG: HAMP domain-containing sensor histidine kinase, partial [Pseudomonadota bacterium]